MAVSYVTGLNPGVRAPATHADRGLLLTLLELVEKRAPRTSTAIALAAGVPEEFAGHIERDIGFEQSAANFAQGLVDVAFRKRTAPGQAIEDCIQPFRKTVEHSKHFCARGRIALSGGYLRPRGAGRRVQCRSLARAAGK